MKTITFYSYKGGVGRSLALSNIAIRLSQLNKKVCVVDFDLDAPGLRFKFKDYTLNGKITKGVVDYIYEFSHHGIIPNKLKDYVIKLIPKNKSFESIDFISAGNIDETDYWKKLSMIRWADMFYGENPQGIRFFLDLKAKIESEVSPDVLLIDSRTGITDISGITLKIFADEVVVLAANNAENIFGCKRIIQSLLKEDSSIKRIPKLNFVLTRLPFTDSQKDKQKEFVVIERRKEEFKKLLGLTKFDISVIHSDRRLEEEERTLINDDYEENGVSISKDYLKLFDLLTEDVLTSSEIERFNQLREAEFEFSAGLSEQDLAKKLIHYDKAIALNNQQIEYFKLRGSAYWTLGKLDMAINDYLKALKISPTDDDSLYNLGTLNLIAKNYDEAIKYFDNVIEANSNNKVSAQISKSVILKTTGRYTEALNILNSVLLKHPDIDRALNCRAEIFRSLDQYKEAYRDIYQAIELTPNQPVYFGTLAEIYADQGKDEEFYLNLTVALSNGITAKNMESAKDVYEKYIDEERFVNLMNKYGIEMDEIFSN